MKLKKKKGKVDWGQGQQFFPKYLPWRFHASKPIFTLCHKWEEIKLRLVEVVYYSKREGKVLYGNGERIS